MGVQAEHWLQASSLQQLQQAVRSIRQQQMELAPELQLVSWAVLIMLPTYNCLLFSVKSSTCRVCVHTFQCCTFMCMQCVMFAGAAGSAARLAAMGV
jgi:hypothetical protein